jgi:hypothetical protein
MVGLTAAQAAINLRHKDGSKCTATAGADAWVEAQTYIRPYNTGPL